MGEGKFVVVRRPRARRLGSPAGPAAPHGSVAAASTLWSAVIAGEPGPAAPLHDVVVTDGAARLVRSRAARLWQIRALAQLACRRPARPLAVDLVLECRSWSGGGRAALEEGLVIELLERAAVIARGAQIVEKHVFLARDGAAPRLALRLTRHHEAG
jgi:hypothetical protein